MSSLRPSPHACVSIPNSYGGNIGYVMPRSSTKSFSEQVADEGEMSDEDTVGRIKRKNGIKVNNNKTLNSSNDEVRTSKISDISYQSSLYEMANGRISNHGSGGSSTFHPEDSSRITPDYYVERTGYAAGTTGFLQGSDEFPEVHFVEVDSQRLAESARLSSLEPIAEESHLHHSDILDDSNDTQQSEVVANMDDVLAEMQSRNSSRASVFGSRVAMLGLAVLGGPSPLYPKRVGKQLTVKKTVSIVLLSPLLKDPLRQSEPRIVGLV